MLIDQIRSAKRVYVIGNGGSYANAMHIVNDLLRCGVRAYSIDPATLSMFANDYKWEYAYALWLAVVAESDDLLIALSGSGTSPNILQAIDFAEKLGMAVWREFG